MNKAETLLAKRIVSQNPKLAGPSAVIQQRPSDRRTQLDSSSSSIQNKQHPPLPSKARGVRGRATHTASVATSVTPAVTRIPWSLVCRVPRGGASGAERSGGGSKRPSSSLSSESGDEEDDVEAGVDADVGGVASEEEVEDTSGEESEVCIRVCV